VLILVDSGSNYNILQPRIAAHLTLPSIPCPSFSVMVGNGSKIQCTQRCPQVDVTIQNKAISIPFYLIPIQGVDDVLGVEWLETLGPFRVNFAPPSITFQHNHETITLKGDTSSSLKTSTYHQICHMLSTDSIASLHLLTITPFDSGTTNLSSSQNTSNPPLPEDI
jgi:predicted aspartyl protease